MQKNISLTIVSMQMLNLLFVIVEIINVEIYLRLCSALVLLQSVFLFRDCSFHFTWEIEFTKISVGCKKLINLIENFHFAREIMQRPNSMQNI